MASASGIFHVKNHVQEADSFGSMICIEEPVRFPATLSCLNYAL